MHRHACDPLGKGVSVTLHPRENSEHNETIHTRELAAYFSRIEAVGCC